MTRATVHGWLRRHADQGIARAGPQAPVAVRPRPGGVRPCAPHPCPRSGRATRRQPSRCSAKRQRCASSTAGNQGTTSRAADSASASVSKLPGRVVGDRRPRAHVLRVTPELLKSERTVRPDEYIDAAVDCRRRGTGQTDQDGSKRADTRIRICVIVGPTYQSVGDRRPGTDIRKAFLRDRRTCPRSARRNDRSRCACQRQGMTRWLSKTQLRVLPTRGRRGKPLQDLTSGRLSMRGPRRR